MKCPKCMRELPGDLNHCPECDRGTGISADPVDGGTARTGLADAPLRKSPEEHQGTGITPESPPKETRKSGEPLVLPLWNPSRQKVRDWALHQNLNHYEVLDLDENAPEDEIRRRLDILEERLREWANTIRDPGLQDIGNQGLNQLGRARRALLERRKEYNEELRRQRHQRAIERLRQRAREVTERDRALQQDEYRTLRREALESGVTEEEFEQIIYELESQGVLVGVYIGGKRCHSLDELKEVCQGRGECLVDVVWNEGERCQEWLRRCLEREDLADEVGRLREQYAGRRELGAQVFLWKIGERRLFLGEHAVTSVQEWVQAVTRPDAREASLKALKDGWLEEWFTVVANRDDLAELARRQRQREDGRAELDGLIAEARGGVRPFRFENGEASSIQDLITLCDTYPDEASRYLFKGYFEKWLWERAETHLASHAQTIAQSYRKQERQGLELFVRKLCEVERLPSYPELRWNPSELDLGSIPVGATVSASLCLGVVGRGYIWGRVTIEPNHPGISVDPPRFEGRDIEVAFRLDALDERPGQYEVRLVADVEGVPRPCGAILKYEIIPLRCRVTPPHISESLLHGKRKSIPLTITCEAPGEREGRIKGTACLEPPQAGLAIEPSSFEGSRFQLELAMDAAELETGLRYEGLIRLETNIGGLRIPVRLRISVPWKIVAAYTIGFSLLVGFGMMVIRTSLGNQWLMSFPEMESKYGSLGALIVSSVMFWYRIKKKRWPWRSR
ncbi:MAG: hypothetical protein QXQ53_01815 [Candidatus Methanosuratincola sp.]